MQRNSITLENSLVKFKGGQTTKRSKIKQMAFADAVHKKKK